MGVVERVLERKEGWGGGEVPSNTGRDERQLKRAQC